MRRSTCALFFLIAVRLSAATFTVTNTNPSGPGSLPDAVAQANALAGPHTINVTATGTVTLTTPLTLTQAMTINGPVATPPSFIIDGGGTTRLIQVSPTAAGPMSLNYLTLTHGHVDSVKGGAIVVPSGRTLNLDHCVVTANSTSGSSDSDPYLAAGGALSVLGTLTAQNSTFSDNTTAGGPGGAIYVGPTGTATVTRSLFTGNSAPNGWAGAMLCDTSVQITITDSTFAFNRSGSGGAGALSTWNTRAVIRGSTFNNNTTGGAGGAMVTNSANDGSIGIENTTMSANSASFGGAIYAQRGTTDLRNVTITGNAAGYSGGINIPGSTVVSIRNSILAGNTVTGGSPDCAGVLASAGYNLIGTLNNCTGLVASDKIVPSPVLSGLADNGGATLTHLPFKGSPAIDGGTPSGCVGLSGQPLLVDQRGQTRPSGAACDIGAVEVTAPSSSAKRRVAPH